MSEATPALPPGMDRRLAKFTPPAEFVPGWRRPFWLTRMPMWV